MKFAWGGPPASPQEPPASDAWCHQWRRIRSPSSRLGYALAAAVGFLFPNLLCAWLIGVSLLDVGRQRAATAADLATPWVAVALALLLYIPLHELLHAVWHPGLGLSSQTVLAIWPKRLRFGVYYDGCMARGRWLVMRTAPLVALSLLPVALLTLFRYLPVPFAWETFLQVLMLVNGIGSGGDVVAVIWVLAQVPAKARICFRGGKAYWRPLLSSGVGIPAPP